MNRMYRNLLTIVVLLFYPYVSFGQVSTELPDIPVGESITFRYRVRVNASNQLPAGLNQIFTQGVLRSNERPEILTDDPSITGSTNPTTLFLSILDSDGDGVGDDIDGCVNDANKSEPGDCGCGTVDTDVNNNEISDCFVNLDIKAQFSSLIELLSQLKPNARLRNKKARRAQKLIKKEIRQLRKELNTSRAEALTSIQLVNSEMNLEKLYRRAVKQAKQALKTGASSFKRLRKKARSTARKVNNAIQ